MEYRDVLAYYLEQQGMSAPWSARWAGSASRRRS